MGKSPGQSAGGEGLVSGVGSGPALGPQGPPSARERDGRERVVGASENLVGSARCRMQDGGL